MIKRVVWLSLLFLIVGCSKVKEKGFTPVYDVPAEFQPLVSRFIQEAAQRGKTIAVTNLIIKYDSSLNNSSCAACNSLSLDPNVQKIIVVNPNFHCYDNANEQEALFFHELGHCVLGRSHDNRLLPNGDPRSIMVYDNIKLYSPCLYPIGGSCVDNSFKRTYYLDELFNEQTPVPSWGH
jgi:hypothetical protein